MIENPLKGTIHVYFAGGFWDGVIESFQDPEPVIRIKESEELEHVYQLSNVTDPDQKSQSAMRGKQAVYLYSGPNYIYEEDDNADE